MYLRTKLEKSYRNTKIFDTQMIKSTVSGIQPNKTRHAKKEEDMTYGEKIINSLKPAQN